MAIRDIFSSKKVCHLLVTDEGVIAKKYNHFMDFLANNRSALGTISELEQLHYGSSPFTMAKVEAQYGKLAAATRNLVEALNGLTPGKYTELSQVYARITQEIAPMFAVESPMPVGELVLPLEALSPEMAQVAGSKATNLATIYKDLGAPIPPGFVVTAGALEVFLQESGLAKPVAKLLDFRFWGQEEGETEWPWLWWGRGKRKPEDVCEQVAMKKCPYCAE